MGRPRQIDRPAILGVSLEIADESGLAAVTMQAVAERLGVTAMALYRHVDSKADLLDGVVESLLAEIPLPPPHVAWDDQLVAMGLALREIARRYPSVFPLLLQRPARTAGARRVRAHVYAVLREAGVASQHIERVERIVSTLAIGFAAGEASGRFRGSRAALEHEYYALATFIRSGIEPFRPGRRAAQSSERHPGDASPAPSRTAGDRSSQRNPPVNRRVRRAART